MFGSPEVCDEEAKTKKAHPFVDELFKYLFKN